MNKIRLKILGISQGNVSSSYTLILEEANGERKLPIIIGVLEAQAIAISLEKIVPVRPMTHDLFKSLADTFGLILKEVVIVRLHEGIFYSNLVVFDGKMIQEIDARTSDAIALSLRFNCPIYATEEVMKDAGISIKSSDIQEEIEEEEKMKEADEDIEESLQDILQGMKEVSSAALIRLKKMLQDAINEEDYIKAARLRDAIKKIEENTQSNENQPDI
ncbi:MAG TPA: DUF151 domain-containing protein [Bacteroidia bacterium]|nr:DUF151 domain-containing protein [Bacteroidia bacterium]HRS58318.1 DUF151 domain-containing protein [Bacteroidia bacterium]HRU69083.1 DUF151 domain-containing protein [Bacteroidia bacterium]